MKLKERLFFHKIDHASQRVCALIECYLSVRLS